MGHCGNAGFRAGDNIYSLRDDKGVAHLTFIVNNGVLGESKGFGNNKPTKSYHPMIVALLLGKDNGRNIVDYIAGGGYAPENNFHFEDLSKDEQKKVLKAKPYIQSYFDFLKFKAQTDPAAAKKHLDDDFGYEFESVDFNKGTAKVKSWDDMPGMITWLKDETKSELKAVPDFEEDFMDWDFDVGTREAIDTYGYSADKRSKALMSEIIEKMKTKLGSEDEDEDYDVAWAAENEDGVADALRFAAEDGMRYGAEDHAYKDVVRALVGKSDENGFDMYQIEHKWELYISLADLAKLHNSGENLTSLIDFKYSAPYNGYDGFDDEAYNERLRELLGELEI